MRATTLFPDTMQSSTSSRTSGIEAKMRLKFSTWAASPEGLRPECWRYDSVKSSGNGLVSCALTAPT